MKKVVLKRVGLSIFVLALIANVQLALIDYGLGINNLGYQLIAQTNEDSSGGDSSGGNKYEKIVFIEGVQTELKTIDGRRCIRSRICEGFECIGTGSVNCSPSNSCGEWTSWTCSDDPF